MKKALLLCALSAAFIIGGCANPNNYAGTQTTQRGLVGPGSVAPVSGGPARPAISRFEP